MGRKRLFVSIGLVLGFVALVVIGLIAMVKREPNFYKEAQMPPSAHRTQLSTEAKANYSEILDVLNRDSWELTFTADQINAFFQEDFLLVGGDDNLPQGFHAPRVRIGDGTMRLGWRWGKGVLSTVLSMEAKFWVVRSKVSTLAMEIVNLQAGSLPLSTGFVLDYITSAARRQNIDVTWFRSEGHPVAVMRFQSDQQRPTFQFDEISLQNGSLEIAGRASEHSSVPNPRLVQK